MHSGPLPKVRSEDAKLEPTQGTGILDRISQPAAKDASKTNQRHERAQG